MADGAHIGVSAARALETILGDAPQPSEGECQTADEMRAEILACTEDPHTYGGTATFMANRILTWLLAHPEHAEESPELVYDWDSDPDRGSDGLKPEFIFEPGWTTLMKTDGVWPEGIDLTGFMWEWAVNAARRCLELPPVANPAIIG